MSHKDDAIESLLGRLLHDANWRNAAEYPDEGVSLGTFAWEFMRRNPEFQSDSRLALPGRRCDSSEWRAFLDKWSLDSTFPLSRSSYGWPVFHRAGGVHVLDPVYPDFDGERLWSSERGMYMDDVGAYGVAFEFSLARTWDEQVREAKRIFNARQADAIKRGGIVKPARARKGRSDYVRFLRAHDGSLAGADAPAIANALSKDDSRGLSEDDVSNALKRARKLIDGEWRALAAHPAV